MKKLLKRLWQCKYLLFAFVIFVCEDNAIDRIIPAVFVAAFGIEIVIKDLFEEYFENKTKTKGE